VRTGSSCSMEGELGCSVFGVYLSSARLGVIWLTSAPLDIRSRPICTSAEYDLDEGAYSNISFGRRVMSTYQLWSVLSKEEPIHTMASVPSHSSSLDPHQHSVAQQQFPDVPKRLTLALYR
jgi:hypothetical protein